MAASIHALQNNPDAILSVMPPDHIIPDNQGFQKTVSNGIAILRRTKILIFGIQPAHTEPAYRYLEITEIS